jgi:hypothetical protein
VCPGRRLFPGYQPDEGRYLGRRLRACFTRLTSTIRLPASQATRLPQFSALWELGSGSWELPRHVFQHPASDGAPRPAARPRAPAPARRAV